jgi:antitoxin component HigA of HigAB toxin-antitoxin module
MDMKPIHTEADYEAALKGVDQLLDGPARHVGRRPAGNPGHIN